MAATFEDQLAEKVDRAKEKEEETATFGRAAGFPRLRASASAGVGSLPMAPPGPTSSASSYSSSNSPSSTTVRPPSVCTVRWTQLLKRAFGAGSPRLPLSPLAGYPALGCREPLPPMDRGGGGGGWAPAADLKSKRLRSMDVASLSNIDIRCASTLSPPLC